MQQVLAHLSAARKGLKEHIQSLSQKAIDTTLADLLQHELSVLQSLDTSMSRLQAAVKRYDELCKTSSDS